VKYFLFFYFQKEMNPIGKKWFTLIEMIIVVVVIWILASFLIPRFAWAEDKAADAARKSHIRTIATALISYKTDQRRLPQWPARVSTLAVELEKWWLTSIPTDPNGSEAFIGMGIMGLSWTVGYQTGDYAYTSIYKNGVKNWWFVVMAKSQTPVWSNFVVCRTWALVWATSGAATTWWMEVSTGTRFNHIILCDSLQFSGDSDSTITPEIYRQCRRASTTSWGWVCIYTDPEQLRYVIKY
jgi:prepilin-type N-terminal cleavage/methylation domain-containing protein